MNSGHFTFGEIRAVVRGGSPENGSALIDHCRTCGECGDVLAAMLLLTGFPASRRRTHLGRYARVGAVAASIAAVGFLGVSVWRAGAADPQATAPLAALATAEAPPAFLVRFQLGTLVPVSSAGTHLGNLQAGGMLIAEGQYERAITVLEGIPSNLPFSPVVATYLGIAQYLAGDTTESTGLLLATSASLRNEAIAELGQWYLANHLLKTGDVDGAREILSRLAPEPTRYGRLAASLLESLPAQR